MTAPLEGYDDYVPLQAWPPWCCFGCVAYIVLMAWGLWELIVWLWPDA